MTHHSEITNIIEKFDKKQLHAARSGRELVNGLVQVALDTDTNSTEELISEIEKEVDRLLLNLPPYAPPLNVLHLIMSILDLAQWEHLSVTELRARLIRARDRYQKWSLDVKQEIARRIFNIIPEDSIIFTFTLSETVSNALLFAWEKGKRFKVIVTESRPNNDGKDTAILLSNVGIPVTFGLDVCMTGFISQSDLVLSGAEAVLEDGNVVCKVGTYLVATVAHDFNVPFYVLVDTMKFNISSRFGVPLPMSVITDKDVGSTEGKNLYNIGGFLFDTTPHSFIRSIVTEQGVISPQGCVEIMNQMSVSQKIISKLTRANITKGGSLLMF